MILSQNIPLKANFPETNPNFHVYLELFDGRWPVYGFVFDLDVDAHDHQGLHVGRGKGLKVVGADLDRAVASQQLVAEVDRDLGDVVVSGHDQGADEVVPAVGPGLKRGDLGACDKIFQIRK